MKLGFWSVVFAVIVAQVIWAIVVVIIDKLVK
jgi:hypothetical protein